MTVKLHIKVGLVEVDYEGSEDFLKSELSNIIDNISMLQPASTSSNHHTDASRDKGGDSTNKDSDTGFGKPRVQLTVNNIASRLNVRTGPELTIAACAYLTFVVGKTTFRRAEILDAMQGADNYYEQTYSKNLSATLDRLVRGDKLIERANDVYALHNSKRQEIEVLLAE